MKPNFEKKTTQTYCLSFFQHREGHQTTAAVTLDAHSKLSSFPPQGTWKSSQGGKACTAAHLTQLYFFMLK